MQEFVFDDKKSFLDKLRELVQAGATSRKLTIYSPYHVHEVDEILPKKNYLKFFTLQGAIIGLIAGFAFSIYTGHNWPLFTSAKPIMSIPAFIIIAFAMTILFGAYISFFGFLILAKIPGFQNIINPKDYGNQFVILFDNEAE
jgi:hypothetical protein